MYIERDEEGMITAAYGVRQYDGQEFVEGAELDDFLVNLS